MDARKKPQPPGAGSNDELRLDPGDVRRYARLMRERQRVGPLGKLVRYVAVVLVLTGAVAAYWNFDTLRAITVQFPDLAALTSGRRDANGGDSRAGTEGTAVVEAPGVVGVDAPTSLQGSPPPAQEAAAPARPAPIRSAAAPPPTEQPESPPVPEAAASSPVPTPAAVPAPAAAPAPPPEPERFSFGVKRIEVSEKDASAAILVLRGGDMRRPSSVRWWTTDGTAKAGQDYVDLGRVVLKFAPSEQNRAIHVPIIGDKATEGPENFYVNLAWGEDEGPVERVEVVIVDDD